MAKQKFDTSFSFGANVKPKKAKAAGGKRESKTAASRRRARYAKGG